ncbi:protein of unknown function [Nitrospira japonica]|uniref:Uncharacterized protein n=1 Tax=Nitrospira japonica TaxID=1325564 RepID=A0A1W1I4U4_9BACT|nr:protein of unknown function [Nitrospira japonica]
MRPRETTYSLLMRGLSIWTILFLLIIAPLAVAQEVHHELAAADTDGHEHSDNDLCQWVQHQSSASINLNTLIFSIWEIVRQGDLLPQRIPFSAQSGLLGPSRAPPRFNVPTQSHAVIGESHRLANS